VRVPVSIESVCVGCMFLSCVAVVNKEGPMAEEGPGEAGQLLVAVMEQRAAVTCITVGRGFAEPLWSWRPAEVSDMTPQQKALFTPGEMNECKPAVYRGERVFLVSAWPSAFAVVRLTDRTVLFVAEAPRNVHSSEVLPDDNLVSVSSGGGDAVRLYSTTTGETRDYPLAGGHGVVWDAERRCLWALGDVVLQRYSYNGNRDHPQLTLETTIELPQPGGHDLYPRARRDELLVTTANTVWVFDPAGGTFEPFSPLADESGNVKSVGEESPGGRIAYTLWDESVRLLNPEGRLVLPGTRLYKARWNRLPRFTYAGGAD